MMDFVSKMILIVSKFLRYSSTILLSGDRRVPDVATMSDMRRLDELRVFAHRAIQELPARSRSQPDVAEQST